ncbi:MAG: CHASE2 domain-containing protein, partial [Burkholderiales bacterium]|nr:CHASE2 domain-containing protein [Burkholderiales bacterium]
MINQSIPRLGFLLPLASVLIGLALLLADPIPLQSLRNNLFDQYQRWSPREQAALPVKIIDIHDESLARLGQWPWPRTRLAEMVDKLNK